MKAFIIAILLTIAHSSSRIRGHHMLLENADVFTARLSSTSPYDVIQLPVIVSVSFSEAVSTLESSHFVPIIQVINAMIREIRKNSNILYDVEVAPEKPGFFSLSITKQVVSDQKKSIVTMESIQFHYDGVKIMSITTTRRTSTTADITVITSSTCTLYGIYSSSLSSLSPSYYDIIKQDQLLLRKTSTTYVYSMSNLIPTQTYTVYITGHETIGTQIATEIAATKHLVTTTESESEDEDMENKSDGTICPSGWGISKSSGKLQLVACSNHGYCQQSKCICIEPFTSTSCNEIKEDSLDNTNHTHQLIHIRLNLWGSFEEQTKLEAYWRASLREILANRLSLSPELIQIRSWNTLSTSFSSLSQKALQRHLVGSYRRRELTEEDKVATIYITVVTDHDMLKLVDKRLNEMMAFNDIKKNMKEKYLTITKSQIMSVFAQEKGDMWYCYNDEKEEEETDIDCGGSSCSNRCMLLKRCDSTRDCIDGLYCTRGKCLDRNWKEVIITTVTIVSMIVVFVVSVICGGVCYQKIKANNNRRKANHPVSTME